MSKHQPTTTPTPPAPPYNLIDVAAAAELFGICTKTIRRRIADGTLPASKVGRVIRIDVADLSALLRRIPPTTAKAGL